MIFGKIDYLNLLPFHVFLKRYPLPAGIKKTIEYKKNVPSNLNFKLRRRKVDAAIISSIESKNKVYKKLNFGIIAKKQVKSVLVQKGEVQYDKASATSNALSKILEINGKVIIGDRALRKYLQNPNIYEDLCKIWYEKYNKGFVFARFCVRANHEAFKNISNCFLQKKIFIPQYILKEYSNTRQIAKKDILEYLKLISYKITKKENLALKFFLKQVRFKNYHKGEAWKLL